MHRNRIKAANILSLVLVIRSIIFLLGFCYTRLRIATSVAVRGLAERKVDANVDIWPMRFEASGHDLNQLNEQINKQAILFIPLRSNKSIQLVS